MIEELIYISSRLTLMHIFCMQFLTACSFLSHAALICIYRGVVVVVIVEAVVVIVIPMTHKGRMSISFDCTAILCA